MLRAYLIHARVLGNVTKSDSKSRRGELQVAQRPRRAQSLDQLSSHRFARHGDYFVSLHRPRAFLSH